MMYNDQHSTLEEEEDFQLVHWLKQTSLKLTIKHKQLFQANWKKELDREE